MILTILKVVGTIAGILAVFAINGLISELAYPSKRRKPIPWRKRVKYEYLRMRKKNPNLRMKNVDGYTLIVDVVTGETKKRYDKKGRLRW